MKKFWISMFLFLFVSVSAYATAGVAVIPQDPNGKPVAVLYDNSGKAIVTDANGKLQVNVNGSNVFVTSGTIKVVNLDEINSIVSRSTDIAKLNDDLKNYVTILTSSNVKGLVDISTNIVNMDNNSIIFATIQITSTVKGLVDVSTGISHLDNNLVQYMIISDTNNVNWLSEIYRRTFNIVVASGVITVDNLIKDVVVSSGHIVVDNLYHAITITSGSVTDSRFLSVAISSSSSGKITAVTSATLVITDKIYKGSFYLANINDTGAEIEITNTLGEGSDYMKDGQNLPIEPYHPSVITFYLKSLPVSATVYYRFETVK